jgi:lipoprotein-releasing system permease protein
VSAPLPPRAGPARQLALGAATAALALALVAALVVLLGFESSRATAVGVSASTLAMVVAGLVLGRGGRDRELRTPWLGVVFASGLLALAAVAAQAGGLGAHSASPELAHGALMTCALVVPALALIGLGAALGARTEARWAMGALAGFGTLVGVQLLGTTVAPLVSWDETVVAVIIGVTTLVSFFAAGAVISRVVRRLGFVEIWLTALAYGYAVFLLVGRFGQPLLERANIPEQQIMVSLSIVPTAISVALLSVGGSIGFLLWGGGKTDTGFGVELMLGLRYLKLQPRWWMFAVAIAIQVAAALQSDGLAVGLVMFVPFALLSAVLWRGSRGALAVPDSERRNSMVSATLVLSIAGVCVGVMALIVVLSVMGGFEEDIKTKILGAHAHVAITKKGDDFSEYAETAHKLGQVDGVESAVAFVLAEGMISSDVGLSGTLVKGIDPLDQGAVRDLLKNTESGHVEDLLHPERISGARTTRVRLTPDGGANTGTSTTAASAAGAGGRDFAGPIISGDTGPTTRVAPGIVIGREMARTLRVRVGDTVNLVSPASEELGPTGPAPKLRRFRVAAIFYSGMYEFDSKFSYVDIKQAQRFFGLSGRATGIELRVKDLSATSEVVEEVKRRVGGHPFAVRDWREMNKELFSALLLEKIAMFIVLTFIILVASFLIVSTLVMIVLEKTREIAILKSMGASDASLMKVFVVQGLIVGFGGATLGLVLGVAICQLLKTFGLALDPDIFYITRLPVVMNWGEIAAVVGSALVITYLASIYPAMAAAAMRPVEGLRDD